MEQDYEGTLDEKMLRIYLNDHLAGSVIAIELIERCHKHNTEGPLGEFLPGLLAEIREDQAVLKELLKRIGSMEDPAKKAFAWLGEKFARLKTDGEPFSYSDLSRLEELELLVLGIRGKLALWSVLEQVAQADQRLGWTDFRELAERARRQHDEVEEFRIEAARRAFLSGKK